MHHQNGVVNKDVKIRDLFPEWSVDGCRRTALGLDYASFPVQNRRRGSPRISDTVNRNNLEIENNLEIKIV